MITPKKYIPKPVEVLAVQVTTDNMEDVALWCAGDVRTMAAREAGDNHAANEEFRYVKVKVWKPQKIDQTQAKIGMWVIKRGANFKVYTDQAFKNNYIDDPNSIPLAEDVEFDLMSGSVFEGMVDEYTKAHQERSVTLDPQAQLADIPPIRNKSMLQVFSTTPPGGIPSFVRKDDEEISDTDKDKYYAAMESGSVHVVSDPFAPPTLGGKYSLPDQG